MKWYHILFLLPFIVACSNESTKVNDEKAGAKPDSLLLAKAIELGNEVAGAAQMKLGGALGKAVSEQGVEGAISFCNANAYSLVDSLEEANGISIRRAALKVRNPKDAPSEAEKDILEKYQHNIYKNMELKPEAIFIGEDILYTKPIVIKNEFCLKCHGTIGEELQAEHYELIKELYPEDNASGHKLGDLRGMWSITIPKKVLADS